MFDIGWQEILIVMGIAVIVVGPKDLPKLVRSMGKWSGKARAYARDFQRSIEEAADISELDEIKKEIAEANRELNEAKRDLGDQAAEVKADMERATKDTAFVRLNSDGSVSEPSDASAAPQKGNGEARPQAAGGEAQPEAAAGAAPSEGPSEGGQKKPGDSQENSANA